MSRVQKRAYFDPIQIQLSKRGAVKIDRSRIYFLRIFGSGRSLPFNFYVSPFTALRAIREQLLASLSLHSGVLDSNHLSLTSSVS